MEIHASQARFAVAAAKLILYADRLGFEVTLGDAYRDLRCPYGAENSKHHRRLAVDLNLFKDGVYLKNTSDHLPLGRFWKSIGGIWGGDFQQRPDGNHYE